MSPPSPDNPFITGESDDQAVYYESSGFDDSEARRRRKTPAQHRQELVCRRAPARMAPTAASCAAPAISPPQVAAEVRRTQAAVDDVQLETRVQGDAVRGALIAKGKRENSTQLAVGLTILSTQLINTFGKADGPLKNPVLQAANIADALRGSHDFRCLLLEEFGVVRSAVMDELVAPWAQMRTRN